MSTAKKILASAAWKQAVQKAAVPPRVKHYVERLAETPLVGELATASPDLAQLLAALFSGSLAMSDLMVAHPEWFAPLAVENFRYARHVQSLWQEVNERMESALTAGDFDGGFSTLRQFKQRHMWRIALRDLARLSHAAEIIREISDVADVCLETGLRLCQKQLASRMGTPYHRTASKGWHPTGFAVIGLGKLGGRELNYSSDVDVVFVYEEEGSVFERPPGKTTAAGHAVASYQFFKRLVENLVTELTRTTPDGTLFRVDLRLRPEGDAGPVARSLSSYEYYYAQFGQTWERLMLLKARPVAGDETLGGEFLDMIHPFRYPRSLGEGVLREISRLKERIENEVVREGELDRNVKLGRGGIREVEFVVQTLQLLHGGRHPFLQGSQTLPALEKLVDYHLLPAADAAVLANGYTFLRDLEHRLQMEHNLQTHTIPIEPPARERLAALMGFRDLKEFESARQEHMQAVRRIYGRLLRAESAESEAALPRQLDERAGEWRQLLTKHGFKDVERSFRLVKQFILGPGYGHVSSRTIDLAYELLPKLFALCPDADRAQAQPEAAAKILSDPDRVLARLDSFLSVYGARATLFETWTHNASLFELLILLFDRSEFLAETAIRTPDLVDELVLSGRLNRRKAAAGILEDLRHGMQDKDQRLWLRRYHQAELMRIGLRDILGLADFEQNLVELSALADACLQYALEVVCRKQRLQKPPFVILGLGKLGGHELNYGSDLDILFVGGQAKGLPRAQQMAAQVMELLSSPTELGVAFHTDARLRPDGEKGLLVNVLRAHEEYYRHRAQLWEIQSMTRIRPVAGDLQLGHRYQTMMAALTNFSQPPQGLHAYRADWKQVIRRMRERIEKERTPAGQQALAIKTGAGGLMDAEFAAQTLCLARGWQEPNTLQALQRAERDGALEAADAEKLIHNYRQLRRVEGILRRWSYEGETELPVDPAPLYRVSVRCGYKNADDFMRAVGQCRQAIREVFDKVMRP